MSENVPNMPQNCLNPLLGSRSGSYLERVHNESVYGVHREGWLTAAPGPARWAALAVLPSGTSASNQTSEVSSRRELPVTRLVRIGTADLSTPKSSSDWLVNPVACRASGNPGLLTGVTPP
jgi:hypothetical protein